MWESPLTKEFQQIVWDERLVAEWDCLLQLAVAEDLGEYGDWTTLALVPEAAEGSAGVVARKQGVVAGLPAVPETLAAFDPRLQWLPNMEDGQMLRPDSLVGVIRGPVRGILMAERTLLNLLGRLSGIATLTQKYVEAVGDAKARIYDTRKTTPGWRRLEKYAVRCGGGQNHRTGLCDAVLIKDNHLAARAARAIGQSPESPAEAVHRARQYVRQHAPEAIQAGMIVEIEVDTLKQLEQVLPAGPDIVLLDNMTPTQLRDAVDRRDAINPAVELEASGGVTLKSIVAIADAGVERISVGALTHSAVGLDLGLDWL